MPIEEAVTSAVVAMEFVRLAVLLELSLVHIHLFGARRPVIIAEQAKQRTVKVLRHVDRRDRCFVVELFLAHYDATAPKFDASVDILFLTRINEGVATAGTGSENAYFAIEVRLRAHPFYGSRSVSHHLGIGNATLGADLGSNIIRIALACALIEVGADREVAMVGEPTRRLDVKLAPARKVVDKHHARV